MRALNDAQKRILAAFGVTEADIADPAYDRAKAEADEQRRAFVAHLEQTTAKVCAAINEKLRAAGVDGHTEHR